MEPKLKIVIIDRNPLRAAILEDGLREAGHDEIILIEDTLDLDGRLTSLAPDVVLVDLESPDRDVLEQMVQRSGAASRPVAMFVDQSDAAMINAAIDAGVSAYIVDGLKKERIKAIVDMTISRFNAFSRLRDELERTKTQLADRLIIDRAKALIMKAKGLSEEQVYTLMRKVAMNEGKKIADVARSIITAAELFK